MDSACAAPRATFDGRLLHPTLYDMAAAYAYHIAGNHPFVDGDKRAGMQAALMFLQLNGIEIHASNRVLVETSMALAQGRVTIARLARLLQLHTQR